jgi:hypothetical protein
MATHTIHSHDWFGLSLIYHHPASNLSSADVLVLQSEPVFWFEAKFPYLSVEKSYLAYSDHEGYYVENAATTMVIQREQTSVQQVQKLYVTHLSFGYFTLVPTIVRDVSAKQGSAFESLPDHIGSTISTIDSIRARFERDDGYCSITWDQCRMKSFEESSSFRNGVFTLWRSTRAQVLSLLIALPTEDIMDPLRSINDTPSTDVKCGVGLPHLSKDSFQTHQCTSLVVKASTPFLIGSFSDHLDLYWNSTSVLRARKSCCTRLTQRDHLLCFDVIFGQFSSRREAQSSKSPLDMFVCTLEQAHSKNRLPNKTLSEFIEINSMPCYSRVSDCTSTDNGILPPFFVQFDFDPCDYGNLVGFFVRVLPTIAIKLHYKHDINQREHQSFGSRCSSQNQISFDGLWLHYRCSVFQLLPLWPNSPLTHTRDIRPSISWLYAIEFNSMSTHSGHSRTIWPGYVCSHSNANILYYKLYGIESSITYFNKQISDTFISLAILADVPSSSYREGVQDNNWRLYLQVMSFILFVRNRTFCSVGSSRDHSEVPSLTP